MGLNEIVFSIFFRESFQQLASKSNIKTLNVLVRKEGIGLTLCGKMKIDLENNAGFWIIYRMTQLQLIKQLY